MKKIVLSLAVVMAAAAFAPEASALPVFARQTGMACSACHFQHFPQLNSFGRSFKSAAFTMVGAQGKVEGDGLSIPDTLNLAMLTTMGYTKTDDTSTATGNGINSAANGTVYVPGVNGEYSLFIGGRTSEFSGSLAEVGLTSVDGHVASAKFPMLWPVGDNGMRVGLVPFTTDGQGASYGFETLNTGANAVHTMLFDGGSANDSIGTSVSAQQYIGTGVAATGAAIVANSDMGFVNFTKYHMISQNLEMVNGASLSSTYVRAAYIFDLNGWDTAVGFQDWSGQSNDASTDTAPGNTALVGLKETKASAIDAQMMGTVNDMPLTVVFSYAKAPKPSGVLDNVYNSGGVTDKKAMVIGAELGVVPEVATVAVSYRKGNNGAAAGSDGDNSMLFAASYKLQQNLLLQLVYTKQSGTAWDANSAGSTQTAINLATLF
jgi:hypothetical protein